MFESLVEPLDPQAVEAYDLVRAECGRFPVDHLAVVELAGEDRKGWLQGQATNNLRSLDFGASSAFCLCEPTGQILAVCEIWSIKDRFIVILDKKSLPAFLKRVEQMVILEDVTARVLEDVHLVSIQGPSATARLGEMVQIPTLDANEFEIDGATVALLRSNRAGQGGWDVLIPASAKKVVAKVEKGFGAVSEEVADILRLEAGIPRIGTDITVKTMPPELGSAFDARHVSYNKGCYTGQEVLMRIHSRGHTNRTWVGLVSDAPLEVGAAVSHSRRPDAGEVTSAGFSPTHGFIGAAMLRNEVAFDGELVTVQTANGPLEAEVRDMPLMRLD